MKYFVVIIIIIVLSYFIYLSKTNVSFNHLFHAFVYEPKDLKENVVYKDLEKIKDKRYRWRI